MDSLRQPLSVMRVAAPTMDSVTERLESSHKSAVTELLLKGFTGRGRAGAKLRVARARVGQDLQMLSQDMDALVAKTRSVDHAMWTLKVFRRKLPDGEVTDFKLRWSVRGLRTEGYRNWEELLPDIRRLPNGMRVWYEEANFLATSLNGLWRLAYDSEVLIARLILLDERTEAALVEGNRS